MTVAEYIKKEIDSDFNGQLPFSTHKTSIKKGTIITDFGQTERNVYFLMKGIVLVEIESKRENRILDFFFGNSFFASYSSLLLNKPSDVRISTFENCILEIIEYNDLKEAYKNSLIANKLGRMETEKLYARKVKREKDFLTKTAEERYASLITTYPEIVQKIPVKDISKYLGIQPESLSRIRKRFIF